MAYPAAFDFAVYQGGTLRVPFRWGVVPLLYKTISGVPRLSPIRLTVTAHGIPDGWPVTIHGVGGMVELNKLRCAVTATVVDTNTIELNAIDGADFSPYTFGGDVRLYTPVDLAGYTARLALGSRTAPALLLTSAGGGVIIDNSAKTITAVFSATATAALSSSSYAYVLELTSVSGEVTPLVAGTISVLPWGAPQ